LACSIAAQLISDRFAAEAIACYVEPELLALALANELKGAERRSRSV
jgi:hypothetical protein